MSEFNRAVKYSQQWQYECVTKQITPNNTINLEDLDQQEREDLIHWEQSRHLSAQNNLNLDDHVGELRVDLGIDRDWKTTYFKYKQSDDLMPPKDYTQYLRDFSLQISQLIMTIYY